VCCASPHRLDLFLPLPQVIAAVTDNSLRVWEAWRGGAQHTLTGHTAHAYILEGHPSDARMLMSAAYDGRIMLWDVVAGVQLARCGGLPVDCKLNMGQKLLRVTLSVPEPTPARLPGSSLSPRFCRP